MNTRRRAFAALIQGEHILMVRVENAAEAKNYWTLPGGGLNTGETYEEAVVREVEEEVNLKVKVVKHLFTKQYEFGIEKCFLVELVNGDSSPTLGFDPELPANNQVLKEVMWQRIDDMREDIQVAEVITVLGLEF